MKTFDVVLGGAVGIVMTSIAIVIWTIFGWVFWGYEMHSVRSYPFHNQAELYSRPGFGQQHLTLWVNNKLVLDSPQTAPGNLEEKLFWDATGQIVTFELNGRKVVTYNATKRESIEETR